MIDKEKETIHIWNEMSKKVAPSIAQLQAVFDNPPEEITRTITLKGASAGIFAFVSKTLELTLGLSEDEAATYLLRMGAEYEMRKRDTILQSIKEDGKE
jgi:hypothetical protein